jgi:hypothetical protein
MVPEKNMKDFQNVKRSKTKIETLESFRDIDISDGDDEDNDGKVKLKL